MTAMLHAIVEFCTKIAIFNSDQNLHLRMLQTRNRLRPASLSCLSLAADSWPAAVPS